MDVFGTIRNAIELTRDMVILIDDIRGAENEKKRLMSDTRACEQILQSLCTSQSNAVAVNEEGETAQQDLFVNALLERIHNDLSTLATTLRASRNIKWPFIKAKVEEQRKRIEWDKNDLLLHLAIRGNKSTTHQSKYLKKHLQKLMTTADDHTRDLNALQDEMSRLYKDHEANSLRISRRDIYQWLAPSEQGEQYSTIKRTAVKGTGDWFLRSDEYVSWRDTANGTLFLCGEAGAGKTFLASLAIGSLKQPSILSSSVATAYYYCDSRSSHESDLQVCIRTLLSQLVSSSAAIPQKLLVEMKDDPYTVPGIDTVIEGLIEITGSFAKVNFVVDAIDEFSASEKNRQDLLKCLTRIQSETKKVNLFVTSRPLVDVASYLQKVSNVSVTVPAKDLALFVEKGCDSLPKFVRKSPALIAKTIATVVSKSQGLLATHQKLI